MIAWPRLSSYDSPRFRKLRKQIRNPGLSTPKAWACIHGVSEQGAGS